jgi:hypothetical protein
MENLCVMGLCWPNLRAMNWGVKKTRAIACLLLVTVSAVTGEEPSRPAALPEAPAAKESVSRTISPELRAAIGKLALPGVKINLDGWCVDVDSRVCLKEGLLELIACTKDTKEHESILMIEAKPSHVHAALLLIGARPGRPATQRMHEGDSPRFISTPPHGGPVEVLLVLKDAEGVEKEHPIRDFLIRANGNGPAPKERDIGEAERFTKDPFVFAGSLLVGDGKGPRQYLCDQSGNVISISTFGDELLCLPGFHENANGALMWQVNGEKLPEVGEKIILRLRPKESVKPAPQPEGKEKAAN